MQSGLWEGGRWHVSCVRGQVRQVTAFDSRILVNPCALIPPSHIVPTQVRQSLAVDYDTVVIAIVYFTSCHCLLKLY